MADFYWLVGVWAYFGVAHAACVYFLADRPLPVTTRKQWIQIIALGPIGWGITVYCSLRRAVMQEKGPPRG